MGVPDGVIRSVAANKQMKALGIADEKVTDLLIEEICHALALCKVIDFSVHLIDLQISN